MIYCPNCSTELKIEHKQVKCTCGYHAWINKKGTDFKRFRIWNNKNGGKKGAQE